MDGDGSREVMFGFAELLPLWAGGLRVAIAGSVY
jgi:hypothetical protein